MCSLRLSRLSVISVAALLLSQLQINANYSDLLQDALLQLMQLATLPGSLNCILAA